MGECELTDWMAFYELQYEDEKAAFEKINAKANR